MSEQTGILVMLTALTTYFMGVKSLEKNPSSSRFVFSVNALFCPASIQFYRLALLYLLVSSLLIYSAIFLSYLLGLLESSHYFSTFSYCCCNRILHYHYQFSDPWKMKHYVCFMYNQIFLDASHIVVVRNNFNNTPLPQIS